MERNSGFLGAVNLGVWGSKIELGLIRKHFSMYEQGYEFVCTFVTFETPGTSTRTGFLKKTSAVY